MNTHRNSLPSRLALWKLHETMLGLRFLHHFGWMHGDIKPENIGVEQPHTPISSPDSLRYVHVVLLDLDSATNPRLNRRLPPTPGIGDTVPYLTPERELEYQSYDSDVWALGVAGYELQYLEHPWTFSVNPWKPAGSEHLQTTWKANYEFCISRLKEDTILFNTQPTTKC